MCPLVLRETLQYVVFTLDLVSIFETLSLAVQSDYHWNHVPMSCSTLLLFSFFVIYATVVPPVTATGKV